MTLQRAKRTWVTVGGLAAVVGAVALVVTRSGDSARASFTPDPYSVAQVVDTNPDPTIVETTITAMPAALDVGGGLMASVLTFNGTVPGPEFRLQVGDTVIVHFQNNIAHATGIHWHGIELDNASDGTPLTQNQVAPGGSFLYKFKVSRPGVYWYHPHHHSSTNQVFKGLVGSLIVTDPNEAPLIAGGVLPSASQTKTLVLSDLTVCKAVGSNDSATYNSSLPWVGGGQLPVQLSPVPKDVCETAPLDEDGAPRGPYAAGDVPNIQPSGTAGRVNEGQTVTTNGVNVGGRAGSPSAPGALAPGASTLDVQAGQGLRLQLVNTAAVRFFRLRLTDSAGVQVPLVRVGGQGGLLDSAIVEGGTVGAFTFKYDAGEILIDPGDRADVVAAIPAAASGVLTLWTEDVSRTGKGFSNIPTVPVAHFNVVGSAAVPYSIAAGTPLRSATGDPVEALGIATVQLLNPASFSPAKPGMAGQNIALTNSASPISLGINGVIGSHEVAGDYASAPHPDSARFATAVPIGSTLELTVENTTDAHHPFHLHGFSIQPLDLTKAASPTYTFPYHEFKDNIDVPAGYTLRFRVRIDDRPMMDGTTLGGAYGRWVFHCHIFFHAVFGMISEFNVVGANGNERPYINTIGTRIQAPGTFTMHGTYHDPDGDPMLLSASSGTIVPDDASHWTWTRTGGASGLVYVTATDSSGVQDQVAFEVSNLCETPIVISPGSPLPSGIAGVAYAPVDITQSGGVLPTTFSVTSGALPAGMTLSPAGVLSGTPSSSGVFNLTVTATDANTCSAPKTYTLTIDCPTMTLSPLAMPDTVAGFSYSQTLTATGLLGTPVFSVVAGALPTGLSLSSGGALTGTPTIRQHATFTVQAAGGGSCAVQRAYTIDVDVVDLIVTGAGAGSTPTVKSFGADGTPGTGPLGSFLGLDAAFTGGVRVASGDVNGDGVAEVIVGAGTGSTRVRVFDGATGVVLREFFAYAASPADGVYVALGDVNADGVPDIVTGPGSGAPLVRAFDGVTGGVLLQFLADAPSATFGARVAVGDINGDLFPEIITSAGPGAAPTVRVFNTAGTLVRNFTAYDPAFLGGVYVAAGDVNGDGLADIVTGADAGGGPYVRVWNGQSGAELRGFFAYAASFSGGVRVAAGDLNGDGKAEVITGAGPGGSPQVKVWDGGTGALTSTFLAYSSSFTGGVFVAAPIPKDAMAIDAPQPNAVVSSSFAVSGWALSEGGPGSSSGVSAIHVWAYPVGGGAPQFVGAAAPGDARPDVAAILGGIYANSGFHVSGATLAPGAYDLAVYAFNARTGTVTQRRIVRVAVQAFVNPCPTPIVISPAVMPAAALGKAYSQTVSAAGAVGPVTFTLVAGTVPAGLSLSGGGAITGPPTLLQRATFSVQATAGSCAAIRAYTLDVNPSRFVVTGPGAGGTPNVRTLRADGTPAPGTLASFLAFDAAFAGGVRVASGDVNGDGIGDAVVGAGVGSSLVRVFDGVTGVVSREFSAYPWPTVEGVYVAVGDVNADGTLDIVTGTGNGVPIVRAFDGRTGAVLLEFLADAPNATGGVRVAVGDVNGDVVPEIVTGAGPGSMPVVRVFTTTGTELRNFLAFDAAFSGGVFVAAGDVNGDGLADIVTGAGGGSPQVRVWNGSSGAVFRDFLAYTPGFAGGVRVAAGDLNDDGKAEVITGPGPGGGPHVRVWDGAGGAEIGGFFPYSASFTGGVFVAAQVPQNAVGIDAPAANAVVTYPFTVSGWAISEGGPAGTSGVSAVHVWAYPVGGGAPQFVGLAAPGVPRPDVAAVFGGQYAASGFQMSAGPLAPGSYDLVIFVVNARTGTATQVRVVRITVL